MTKEQECLSQLEKERQDYYKVLDWLKGNEERFIWERKQET